MEMLVKNGDQPRPYEPIDLDLTPTDIKQTMDSFLDFLALPEAEKAKIYHFDETKPRTGMSGYIHKNKSDIKDVFHFTQLLDQELGWNRYALPGEVRNFMRNAGETYYSLGDSVKTKYRDLEEEMPSLVGIHFPRSGKLSHHLRFLAYKDSVDGSLAQGHYDKGTGTVAVAESHGGLRLGYGIEDLELLERNNFDPLFFRGLGWHQLAEMLDVNTRHRAAWHDIIDTGEQVDDQTKRWSMVYFVDPANIYLESTQEQTHTPIPWRGLGSMALRSDNKSFLN